MDCLRLQTSQPSGLTEPEGSRITVEAPDGLFDLP